MEAEAQKIASEREHLQIAAAYTSAQKEMQDFMRSFKTSINKSCPYFHHRTATQIHLEAQKDKIHKLQKEISLTKLRYSLSLRNLEQISEEIHELRRSNMKREPGVGAEMNHSPNFFETHVNDCSETEAKLHEEHQYWKDLKMKLNELHTEDTQALKEESLCFDEYAAGSIASTFSALPHSDNLSLSYEHPGNCKALVTNKIVEPPKLPEKKEDLYSLIKNKNGIKKVAEVNVPVESQMFTVCTVDKPDDLLHITHQGNEDSCIVEKCGSDTNILPFSKTLRNIDPDFVLLNEVPQSKGNNNEQQNEKRVERILEKKPSETFSESMPTNEAENEETIAKPHILLNSFCIPKTNVVLENCFSHEESVHVNDSH